MPPIIITLIQPPASGKTTVLRRIEKRCRESHLTATYLSMDAYSTKYGPQIAGERYFADLKADLKRKDLRVIILDMCHSRDWCLEYIKARQLKVVWLSTLKYTRPKRGYSKLEPTYLERLKAQAQERIISRDYNESTLVRSESIEPSIVFKAERCLVNIARYKIPVYPVETLDHLTEIVWTLLERLL